MPFASSLTFGGETLNIIEFTSRTRQQATIKQRIGQSVTEIPTPGRDAKDWRFSMRGLILPPNIDTKRGNLEALDDGNAYPWSDGLYTGSFVVLNLSFADRGTQGAQHYEYVMDVVEYNQ